MIDNKVDKEAITDFISGNMTADEANALINETAYDALRGEYSEADLNNMLDKYGLNTGDWAGLKAAIEGDTAATEDNTDSNNTNTESNEANTEANEANTVSNDENTKVTTTAVENNLSVTKPEESDQPFDKSGN